MKKRVFTLLLALGLALILGGCGDKARPSSDAPSEPSSIEVRPGGSEGSGIPRADDDLVKEIVLTYGAEEVRDADGSPRLVPTGISMYYRYEPEHSWEGAEALTPADYFGWFFSSTIPEDYDYKLEAYRHPRGEEYGWFFPQDVYEERVRRYFDISVDFLRSDPTYYHAEEQGYSLDAGGGKGELPTLTYEYTQDGDTLTVAVTSTYSFSPSLSNRHTLTVRLEEGGGWKYLADRVESLN